METAGGGKKKMESTSNSADERAALELTESCAGYRTPRRTMSVWDQRPVYALADAWLSFPAGPGESAQPVDARDVAAEHLRARVRGERRDMGDLVPFGSIAIFTE